MIARFIYTAEQLHFLAETFKEHSLDDTTAMFNFVFGQHKTRAQIRACFKNHGITCDRPKGQLTKGRLLAFTDAQRDWITHHYQTFALADLVPRFNAAFNEHKSESQIRAFIKNHGILSGRTGHFSKGDQPWNAGLKGWTAGGNAAATRFKPGNTPPNWRPVGSERVNVEGYIEIKVAEPSRWMLKHRHVWQQANGPVPAGQLIWFIDNDPQNCDLANLMLVSRAEHAVTNKLGLQAATGELKQTARLIAGIAMARQAAKQRPNHRGDTHERTR